MTQKDYTVFNVLANSNPEQNRYCSEIAGEEVDKAMVFIARNFICYIIKPHIF